MSRDQRLASTQVSSHLQHQHVEQSANDPAARPGYCSRTALLLISGDENQCDKWRCQGKATHRLSNRQWYLKDSLAHGVCSELWNS